MGYGFQGQGQFFVDDSEDVVSGLRRCVVLCDDGRGPLRCGCHAWSRHARVKGGSFVLVDEVVLDREHLGFFLRSRLRNAGADAADKLAREESLARHHAAVEPLQIGRVSSPGDDARVNRAAITSR